MGNYIIKRGYYKPPANASVQTRVHKKYSWGDATYTETFTQRYTGRSVINCSSGEEGGGYVYRVQNTISNKTLVVNFKGNIIRIAFPNVISNGIDRETDPCEIPQTYSCFPAGNMVLLYKQIPAWTPIENVKTGDYAICADGVFRPIVDVETPLLGNRKMLNMDDNTLTWSEEHSFWTRDSNNNEWAWAHNKPEWLKEANEGVFGGLKDNDSIRTGNGYEFATTNGFEHKTYHIETKYKYNTQLYYPRVNTSLIIIGKYGTNGKITGYVVSGGIDEHVFNYKKFRWNKDITNNMKVKDVI